MDKQLCWFLLTSTIVFTIKSQAGASEMRIVFVLDSSGSTSSDWAKITSFVQTIADSINITQDAGLRKAGIVVFDGTDSQVKYLCASMPTTAAFESTVTNLQKGSGLTDIIGGLNAGREVMQSCSQDATTQNIAKYIVLMTDGLHNRPIGSSYNDIYAVADQIRADGAIIYGVSFYNTRLAELTIVTDNNLFSVDQISDLTEQLAINISDEIKKNLQLMTTAVSTTTIAITAFPTTTVITTTPVMVSSTTSSSIRTELLSIKTTLTNSSTQILSPSVLFTSQSFTSPITSLITLLDTTSLSHGTASLEHNTAIVMATKSEIKLLEIPAESTVKMYSTSKQIESSLFLLSSISTSKKITTISTSPLFSSASISASKKITRISTFLVTTTLKNSSTQILSPSVLFTSQSFTSPITSLITLLNTTSLSHGTASLEHNTAIVMATKSEIKLLEIPAESTVKIYSTSKQTESPLFSLASISTSKKITTVSTSPLFSSASISASKKITTISTFLATVSAFQKIPRSIFSTIKTSRPTTAIVLSSMSLEIYTSIIASTTINKDLIIPKPSSTTPLKPTASSKNSKFYGILTLTVTWKHFCNSSEEFCIGLAKLMYPRTQVEIQADQIILLNLDNCDNNLNETAVVKFYISSDNEPNREFTKASVDILKELISNGNTTDLATNFVNGTMQKAEFFEIVDEDVQNNAWPAWLISITVVAPIIGTMFVGISYWIAHEKVGTFPIRKQTNVGPALNN